MEFYGNCGKRFLDLAITIPLIVLTAPIMLLTALAIRLRLGSPVLFRQERPGLGGSPFTLSKFRSMTNSVDDNGIPLPDKARLTSLGRFLRRFSLDELPELYNVLTGDMSLVGPRPLRMRYLERYTEEQMRRHQVLPGITGLAQVHGRNMLDWNEKFRLDLEYVDNLSIGLDLSILLRTLVQVAGAGGISAEGHATMSEFLGSTAEPKKRSDRE
jgi:lipopolysaccharide/colanic/teichoic acid biosynthesis glycosyltransferase